MAKGNAALIAEIAAGHARDPGRLMDIVREVQARLGWLSDEAVTQIARELGIRRVRVQDMASFYSFFEREPRGRTIIRLSRCVVNKMKGVEQVALAFQQALGIPMGGTTADGKISLEYTECIGMCDQAPAALVNGLVVTDIQPKEVPAIVEAVRQGPPIGPFGCSDGDARPGGGGPAMFPNAEVLLNLRRAGEVVFAPMERGAAIRRALNMTPEGVIDEVNRSRLRGRGGAGFPTAMKWSICRKAKGDRRYVICNADEGEPGTFKDRLILTEAPDLLFEGMAIAGYALGASEGIMYLRAEYQYLWGHLQQVLARRRRYGLLGEGIAGREDFRFDIRVQMGAGAYVCGEESALIESMEGKRGAPRDRPPYPVQKGYLGQPSSVNNIETFCAAARVLEKGAEWFAAIGTKDSTGTKLVSVSGDCRRPGVYEIPYGMHIAHLLGLVGGEDAQAVQVGGPSGQCLGPKDFGRRIAFEDIPTGGSVIVFGPGRDLLAIVRDFTEFFVEESCGWCVPCRVGASLLLRKMEKILAGRGTASDLKELKEWGGTVKVMSRCGLGQTAANPILSTLQNFPQLYQQRITREEFIPDFDVKAAFREYAQITGRDVRLEE